MRLTVLALVMSLGCSGTFGSTTRIVPRMKSPRGPMSCVPLEPEPNIALQVLPPVLLFAVGAVVVGGAYLAIGGEAP